MDTGGERTAPIQRSICLAPKLEGNHHDIAEPILVGLNPALAASGWLKELNGSGVSGSQRWGKVAADPTSIAERQNGTASKADLDSSV